MCACVPLWERESETQKDNVVCSINYRNGRLRETNRGCVYADDTVTFCCMQTVVWGYVELFVGLCTSLFIKHMIWTYMISTKLQYYLPTCLIFSGIRNQEHLLPKYVRHTRNFTWRLVQDTRQHIHTVCQILSDRNLLRKHLLLHIFQKKYSGCDVPGEYDCGMWL